MSAADWSSEDMPGEGDVVELLATVIDIHQMPFWATPALSKGIVR